MDPLPPRLIDDLGWTNCVEQVTRMPPGLSGALVYRVRIRELGEFAVKRLPAGTRPSRVIGIHRVIDAIRHEGAVGLPAFQAGNHGSVFQVGADLWEASRWQPGKPLAVDAAVDKIAAGAAAIGAFHRVSMKIPSHAKQQVPKSITERVARLSSINIDLRAPAIASQRYLDELCESDFAIRTRFEEALTHAMVTLRQGWPIVGEGLCQRLRRWTERPVSCCFVMRDIHREHALFDNGQIRFIDFDAARVDTPALDLARWIGSFATPDRTDIDAIYLKSMAEHEREKSSTMIDGLEWTELVRLLQESGAWGALANWVNWAVEGRQFDAGAEYVTKRIQFVADAARASLPK